MKVTETRLPGVLVIEPRIYSDARGFFLETFQAERYRKEAGIALPFIQDNHSRSVRGVLRGMHAQRRRPQGKLMRVARGEIFDVAVDIDPMSKTYGQWAGMHLSDKNCLQFWVPPGYAHGFLVLSEVADIEYKCTDYYEPDDEIGLIWNDPDVAIDWPIKNKPLQSARDQELPTLATLRNSR
jgi:dTDP-4-dehydrorhamnose 3,5-epimerase